MPFSYAFLIFIWISHFLPKTGPKIVNFGLNFRFDSLRFLKNLIIPQADAFWPYFWYLLKILIFYQSWAKKNCKFGLNFAFDL